MLIQLQETEKNNIQTALKSNFSINLLSYLFYY